MFMRPSAGCGWLPCADGLRRTAEALADAIEEDVDDRRGVEREHLAEQQSADHGDAQRTAQLRAHAVCPRPAECPPAARPWWSS